MSRTKATATVAWLFAVGATVAGLLLRFTTASLVGPIQSEVFVIPLIILAFSTTGLFISNRRPGHRIGVIYLASGVLGGIYSLSRWYSISAKFQGWPGDVAGRLSEQFFYLPWILATVSLPMMLFPDGRFPSPRWRWLRWVGAMFIVVLLLGLLTHPHIEAHIADIGVVAAEDVTKTEGGVTFDTGKQRRLIESEVVTTPAGDLLFSDSGDLAVTESNPGVLTPDGDLSNPMVIDAITMPASVRPIWSVGLLSTLVVLLAAAPAALVVRFIRSEGDERQQMKWLVLPAVVAGVGLALTYSVVDTLGIYETFWARTLVLVVLVAVLSLPVVTGMAIVRYRLYDIDRLISRTVVYGVLVALLIGTYLGVVFLLSQFVPDENSITVAIATLAVAGLFNPLRRRIQDTIDRRLYRSRYDAQEIVEEFSGRLTDEVDVETIHSELLEVLDETVKPETAALWIRGQQD